MFNEIVLDDGTTYEPTEEDREFAIRKVMKNLRKNELIELVLDYTDIYTLELDFEDNHYDEMYEILYNIAVHNEDKLKLIKEEEKRRHS